MKQLTNIVLLSAGILLSLTGCQKGTGIDNAGKKAQFSASTGYETRTAYSGDRFKKGDKNYERIDWTAGDQIMVWSDYATVRPEGTPYFSGNNKLAVYNIGTITDSDEKSIATIEDPLGNGLQYPDSDSGTQFWGVYPASAVTESPENNTILLTIDAVQDLAENENTTTSTENPYVDYVPDMSQAYLLAYVNGAKASSATVDLPFKPAFTDFEFNLEIPADATAAADYTVNIKAIEITSTTSALSGDFTATCTNGTWAYTIAEGAAKSAKAVLPEGGFTINAQNPKLSLNVFALPQDLTNMKVTFYTNEGTKTLKLINKKENASDADSWITFAGAKKHRLNGIILPTGWLFSYITLDLQVLEWKVETLAGASEEFPQTTQFSVTGAKNGNDDLHLGESARQQWYFQSGQTVTVTFKVMLPAGGTWEVVPMGGSEATPVAADASLFTVKNVSPGDGTVENNLYGPIGTSGSTDVKLEITYNGNAGEEHSFYFLTYAYSDANKEGQKYSIDSETQLYDRGRGYHTFIVNSPLYNN